MVLLEDPVTTGTKFLLEEPPRDTFKPHLTKGAMHRRPTAAI